MLHQGTQIRGIKTKNPGGLRKTMRENIKNPREKEIVVFLASTQIGQTPP